MTQPPGRPDHAQPYYSPGPASDPVSTIIPYRNGFALASYYLGVFSIIPCIGLPLAITAIIFGILGLKAAARKPEAKGKVHAIVGLVLGGIFGLIWLGALVFVLIGMIAARRP